MTEVDIWDRPEVVDVLDSIIERGDKLDLILAQLPGLFGTSEKATYLGFRSVGLTCPQALEILNKTETDWLLWRVQSDWFREFEDHHLWELQARVGADIVRLGFLRNMTMFLFKDQQVIRKAMNGMDDISEREYNYFRAVRRFYTTHDLLALNKATDPEKHRDNVLVLSFENNHYEITESEPKPRLIEGETAE